MEVSIGRIVLYTLTAEDVKQIDWRRDLEIEERNGKITPDTIRYPIGLLAFIGHKVQAGDTFPLVITRVGSYSVGGQAMLDGPDCFWVVDAREGVGPGTWRWPERG
jgi:hypothetical protein